MKFMNTIARTLAYSIALVMLSILEITGILILINGMSMSSAIWVIFIGILLVIVLKHFLKGSTIELSEPKRKMVDIAIFISLAGLVLFFIITWLSLSAIR